MNTTPYIAFEGPIAAGKTTLAQLLARYVGAEVILEEFENNEFLGDFYLCPERWSLPMQLWFLSARIPALKQVRHPRTTPLVADYSARKDQLFARLLLDGRELRLFNRISQIAVHEISGPDLIVYLDAHTDALLERIKRRGRPYEEKIDGAYLNALRMAYDEDLTERTGLNVLRYDTTALNLECEAQLTSLYELIMASIPPRMNSGEKSKPPGGI